MNIELIATQVGDDIKNDTTVNHINRIASAIFKFPRKEFPNEAITSVRAQLIYDWIMTLNEYSASDEERNKLLIEFLESLAPGMGSYVTGNQSDGEDNSSTAESEASEKFDNYRFHPEIVRHCKTLYAQGHYFHAIFEAAKAFNGLVKSAAQSEKDGQDLMLNAWDVQKGNLKINSCNSQTERNIQEGIKFMSAGLMRAVRNPTAHEPALQWPVDEQDAADILSLVSFLLRQYDKAVS